MPYSPGPVLPTSAFVPSAMACKGSPRRRGLGNGLGRHGLAGDRCAAGLRRLWTELTSELRLDRGRFVDLDRADHIGSRAGSGPAVERRFLAWHRPQLDLGAGRNRFFAVRGARLLTG